MASPKKPVVLAQAHNFFPSFLRSRTKAIALDEWMSGRQYNVSPDDPDSWYHGRPYIPRGQEVSDEYTDLATRTATPWAGLIVTSLAQTAYVDGMRMPGKTENMKTWDTWQRNNWDAKQTAVNRTAIGLSAAFGIVMPGTDPLTGNRMPKMLARSPKRVAAFYAEDDDDFPLFALDATPYGIQTNDLILVTETGWNVTFYDETFAHTLRCKGDGSDIRDWTYVTFEEHGQLVCPVARLANRIDLDGRTTGEIEPVLPLLRRIDQDTFDRLIVQRFGAWKVRYISGMAKPSTQQQADIQAMRLRIEDLLISGSPDTKFGTLDETPLDGFIGATDHDLRMLSAVTQIPPHHLLGLSSNLQAEALAAAESGLQRKSGDFRMNAGNFYENMARLTAVIRGDKDEANAFDMQVRWRDTESRSLSQAAVALGQLAVQLKVPVEMLWEKIPGWTDGDSTRAKALIENGSVDALLQALTEGLDGNGAPSGNQPTA